MRIGLNTSEAYWNSYRLLENQLVRLSHSISFDDNQIDVYSAELADIINSACIKIESLAKDIYEEHICPFQLDNAVIPNSFTSGKYGRKPDKFNEKNWTREKWKYDYNCLVEIDEKYSISKKRIKLKSDHFNFLKYGEKILPFYNIGLDECTGGKWEYNEQDIFGYKPGKLIDVDWCKSYQEIKHNYIQSIPLHGTVKNAIITLSAYYLLVIYKSCLPTRYFNYNDEKRHEVDFESSLFTCEVYFQIMPSFIIDSERERNMKIGKKSKQEIKDQDILYDIDGAVFFYILKEHIFNNLRKRVGNYCEIHNEKNFDLAKFKEIDLSKEKTQGALLYQYLQNYICNPYNPNYICIAFNTGMKNVYDNYSIDLFNYEKSKYLNRNAHVLNSLKIGDFIDVKFTFTRPIIHGEITKFDENRIDVCIEKDGKKYINSQAIESIIYIKLSQ